MHQIWLIRPPTATPFGQATQTLKSETINSTKINIK